MAGQFINRLNSGGGLRVTNNSDAGNLILSKSVIPLLGRRRGRITSYSNITPYSIGDTLNTAQDNGQITIPDFNNLVGLLNPDMAGSNVFISLYINPYDSDGTDRTSELAGLVGNHTHLTLSWGTGDYTTYDCQFNAFQFDSNQGTLNFYYDAFQGSAPFSSLSVLSSSGTGASYSGQPITISYNII
jgi:hypothetical protein